MDGMGNVFIFHFFCLKNMVVRATVYKIWVAYQLFRSWQVGLNFGTSNQILAGTKKITPEYCHDSGKTMNEDLSPIKNDDFSLPC